MRIEPFKISSDCVFLQARRFYRATDLPERFLEKKTWIVRHKIGFILLVSGTIRDISGLLQLLVRVGLTED